ncbi:loricrin-like [Pistacia vera]|uniref:loricrin-like n=1 Tax=Pistacia vera TaxID=55513 RepID=UPI001263B5AF|nr:loricrin-like [Pistacia vera]
MNQFGQYNVPSYRPFGYISNGRGRGRNNGRGKPICQVCGKMGHTAIQCYHRYNSNYNGSAFQFNSSGYFGGALGSSYSGSGPVSGYSSGASVGYSGGGSILGYSGGGLVSGYSSGGPVSGFSQHDCIGVNSSGNTFGTRNHQYGSYPQQHGSNNSQSPKHQFIDQQKYSSYSNHQPGF